MTSNTFQALGLPESVLQAVEALGFTEPSPIQQQAIPVLLNENRDIIGLAQTGTGKTAAFGLPLIARCDFDDKSTQALIIAPTRELGVQIANDLVKFAKFSPNAAIVPVYGGASIETQIRALKRGAQIVVATPGRLVDLIKRRAVKLDQVRYVVLDEADEMLNMGFRDDIDTILDETRGDRKVWLFSATMPREVADIARRYMTDPIEVTVGHKNQSASNIVHRSYVIDGRHRYAALRRLLDYHPTMYGLVFCNTRATAREVAEKLQRDGYNADALHGDLSQAQRDYVMGKFRNRTLQVLVATDVASRGIDVNNISHVMHYHLPDDVENYTHRSGRTARAGKSGESLALVGSSEQHKLREIERVAKLKFELSQIPTGEEVCGQQLMALVERVKDVSLDTAGMARFLPHILDELKDFEVEDIIARFVSVEFNRFLEAYRNAPDLNKKGGKSSEKGEKRAARQDMVRLFIGLGAMDRIKPGDLVRITCETAGISSGSLGHIDIKREFSFVDAEPEAATKILDALNGTQYQGRSVRVDIADGNKRSGDSREGGRRFGGGGSGSSGGYNKSSTRSKFEGRKPFKKDGAGRPGRKKY